MSKNISYDSFLIYIFGTVSLILSVMAFFVNPFYVIISFLIFEILFSVSTFHYSSFRIFLVKKFNKLKGYVWLIFILKWLMKMVD